MAIARTLRIDDHTTLIDGGMYGVAGTSSVYLVRGRRTCLVDTGDGTDTSKLVARLRALDAFPPDKVVLTHTHYDHSQGVPGLRRAASSPLQVLAGRASVPLLADQSWNGIFKAARGVRDVPDVDPLDDGDVIGLGGVELEVLDTPGHTPGHIALFDRENGNLFTGDALGDWFGGQAFVPPFVPPYWDREAFDATLARLRSVGFGSVCFGHYGCLRVDDVDRFLDHVMGTCDLWWETFERAEEEGWLDDAGRLGRGSSRRWGSTFPSSR